MSSVQPTDFPRFLELPFEIRWTIYGLCLPMRVVDGEINNLGYDPDVMIREKQIAVRYIVTRYSRTPVIARAIPEVYRELQSHVVEPPNSKWVWSWRGFNLEGFTDSAPIFFDLRSDVLYISPDGISSRRESQKDLHKTPFSISQDHNATLAIDERGMSEFLTSRMFAKQCLLGRKKCIIVLTKTRLIKSAEWIASCGLFGVFGEERIVLVDVDDFERIDYFDRKLNGQGMTDGEIGSGYRSFARGGIRRYSSHSNVDLQATWHEGSPLVSVEERAEVIAKDKKEMSRRFQLVWLMINEPSAVSHLHKRVIWDQSFDQENPKARLWLDKLPAFTFAVRVHVQDLQEGARLTSARDAHRRVSFETQGFCVEDG